MVHVLLVKSNGSIVEKNVKALDETQLYKVCNYKNDTDFELINRTVSTHKIIQ